MPDHRGMKLHPHPAVDAAVDPQICPNCHQPKPPGPCPCLSVEFVRRSGAFDGSDSFGVVGQFTEGELLAWVKWHLDRGRVLRLTAYVLESDPTDPPGVKHAR